MNYEQKLKNVPKQNLLAIMKQIYQAVKPQLDKIQGDSESIYDIIEGLSFIGCITEHRPLIPIRHDSIMAITSIQRDLSWHFIIFPKTSFPKLAEQPLPYFTTMGPVFAQGQNKEPGVGGQKHAPGQGEEEEKKSGGESEEGDSDRHRD